jgi:hypothetical protein
MKKLLLLGAIGVLLVAVGCKSQPGYVGTFGVELSADQKKELEGMKAMLKQIPEKDRKQAEEAFGAIEKMELNISADGTWKATGAPGGKDVTGTYKVEGNVLTMTTTAGTGADKTPGKLEYVEADKTLIANKGEKGKELTFKKK